MLMMMIGTGVAAFVRVQTDAIELRHDEIARDHIRIQTFDQIQCFATVARRADNLDERTARKDLLTTFRT